MITLNNGQDSLIYAHGYVLYYIDMNMISNWIKSFSCWGQIHGLVQDCSNSVAYVLELLQFCTKPST